MKNPHVFEVAPSGDLWTVTFRDRIAYTVVRHSSKEKAVQDGRSAAQASPPSELVIRREDGTIEERLTWDGPDRRYY
jgi:hypothetical protein